MISETALSPVDYILIFSGFTFERFLKMHLWVVASHGQFTSNMEFDTYSDTYIV